MDNFLGRKLSRKFTSDKNKSEASEQNDDTSKKQPSKEKLSVTDIQKYDLYNKGINHMSNEKLSDAIRIV